MLATTGPPPTAVVLSVKAFERRPAALGDQTNASLRTRETTSGDEAQRYHVTAAFLQSSASGRLMLS